MRKARVREYATEVVTNGKKYSYHWYKVTYRDPMGKRRVKYFPFTEMGKALADAFANDQNNNKNLIERKKLDTLEGNKIGKNYRLGMLRGIYFTKGNGLEDPYPAICVDIRRSCRRKVKRSRNIGRAEDVKKVIDDQIKYLISEMGWNPHCKEVIGRSINTSNILYERYRDFLSKHPRFKNK